MLYPQTSVKSIFIALLVVHSAKNTPQPVSWLISKNASAHHHHDESL